VDANPRVVAPSWPWLLLAIGCIVLWSAAPSEAAGVAAGTSIENTASVSFDLAGSRVTQQSNTTTIVVAEVVDVVVTLQSPQQVVAPGATGAALLFRITNTGNGTEDFTLAVDNAQAGDDFDPLAQVPAIYFDTDGSGDFNTGDLAYDPGTNDPQLPADASVDVLVVNDIPSALSNGSIGRSRIDASAATGTGAAGTVYAGQGDGGVDAVIGSSGGTAGQAGEYLVSDVGISVVKAQLVEDQFGGNEPVPGATIVYTIEVEVSGTGTATASTVSDPIPEYTTYLPGSLQLNATPLSDAADADAGEYDASAPAAVTVRLGDLTAADGIQTIEFRVTID